MTSNGESAETDGLLKGPQLRRAWRALDRRTRMLIDQRVGRGEPLKDPRLAAIAAGRAAAARRQERLTILLLSGAMLLLPSAIALTFHVDVMQVIARWQFWFGMGVWTLVVLPLYFFRRRRLERAERLNRVTVETLADHDSSEEAPA